MSQKKLELEIEKAELEIKHLKSKWGRWSAKYLPLITTCIAVAGFWWSVHQFNVQQSEAQTWKRAEFLATAVKEFDSEPSVHNAKLMLDTLKLYSEGRKIKLFPDEQEVDKKYIKVTPDDIYNALAIDKESLAAGDEKKLEKWIAISDCFDVFLSGLEQFDNYIKSGLMSADEVKLDLIYWIELIGDEKVELKKPGCRERLLAYADYYKFPGVRSLLARYGYTPKKSSAPAVTSPPNNSFNPTAQ